MDSSRKLVVYLLHGIISTKSVTIHFYRKSFLVSSSSGTW